MAITTPSADFCCTVRAPYDVLSHDSVTNSRSPEISSTAFDTRPPDLPPVPLMDMGFAVTCQLARHRRPHHPVLVHRPVSLLHASFGPYLTVTPLRFATLHLHQVGTGLSPVAAEHARRTTQKPPICIGGSEKLRAMDRPRYMNVPSPAPCHVNVAGVGK